MKIPKELNVYCPKCRGYTQHSVSLYKRGRDRVLAAGARRHEREKHGYGGQKYPELKRTAKTTKKATLKMSCRKCGFTVQRKGMRLRKAEIK
ncbi:MAG: 50S ribosomal protein L44e [Candidatus Bathyarchaeia archaeon]